MISGENYLTINQHFTDENLNESKDMFKNCFQLEKLDLSNFKGEEIKNISSMFYNCSKLSFLDLSNFDSKSIQYIGKAFYGLPNNGTLKYNSEKLYRSF